VLRVIAQVTKGSIISCCAESSLFSSYVVKTGASSPKDARRTPQKYTKNTASSPFSPNISPSPPRIIAPCALAWLGRQHCCEACPIYSASTSSGPMSRRMLGMAISSADQARRLYWKKKEGIRKPQPKCDKHPLLPSFSLSLLFPFFRTFLSKSKREGPTSCIVTNYPSMPVSRLPVADKVVHPNTCIGQGSKRITKTDGNSPVPE